MRPTLLVVTSPSDEALLHLAGTVVRYTWQGIRTVLVTVAESADDAPREVMEHAATLLGVEHFFYRHGAGASSASLARMVRSFQPQSIITVPRLAALTMAAWEIAQDATVPMPGLPPLAVLPRLWHPAGNDAAIAVPLTEGIRHALYCALAAELPARRAWQHMVAEQKWQPIEHFAWCGGAPLPSEASVTDLFSIPAPNTSTERQNQIE